MSRSRTRIKAVLVAVGAASIVVCGAYVARAQTSDDSGSCDVGACSAQPADSSGDISNGSGSIVIEGDQNGSPTISNESGAILIEDEGSGSPTITNDSGAVVLSGEGLSPTIDNESGSVLVKSEPVTRRAAPRVFVPEEFVHERFVSEAPTRLPVTGIPVGVLLAMGAAMVVLGCLLLATSRLAPRGARVALALPVGESDTVAALRGAVQVWWA